MISKLKDFIKELSHYRDGLLLIVSFLYVWGYFTWSLFAAYNELGPLPAIDAQYFVAGAPVLIIVLLTVITTRLVAKFYDLFWPKWIEQRAYITRLLLNMLGLVVIFWAIYHWGAQLNPKAPKDSWHNQKIFTVMLLIMNIGLTFLQHPRKPLKSNGDAATSLNLTIVALSIYCFIVYMTSIYPNLPQELGGAKPRCAQLDILSDHLSPSTLSALVKDKQAIKNRGTIRSREIWVLFSGGDKIIASLTPSKQVRGSDLIEIKQNYVSAISWCK